MHVRSRSRADFAICTVYPQRLERRNCLGGALELTVFYGMEDADGYKRSHVFDDSSENVTAI